MYKPHTYCRACGYGKPGAHGIKSEAPPKLIEVFNLGVQPLANSFTREGEEQSGYAPLKVLFCPRCTLAQLSVVVDPRILYSKYCYVTSPSAMMQEHFTKLIGEIESETNGKTVLEIGSNDGLLLSRMKERGYTVLGIDPAANLCDIAEKRLIPTDCALFSERTAQSYLTRFDIIIARHVFCHIDDWQDFVRGLETISHEETLICIEAPYVGDTLKNVEFDTVYHEHLSYLSIQAMYNLLKGSSFYLDGITRYPIHGGTMLFKLRHHEHKSKNDSVKIGLDDITFEDWKTFSDEAFCQINRLKRTVDVARGTGKTVAALGASAKSTVWINACGFTKNDIAFIADNTPQKQLTFSPGTDIPILDEGAILRELPDYVILFAWNFREEILEKFSLARSKGVKFIVPVPRVEII